MSRPQILFLSCIGFAVALTAMLYGNIIKPSTVTSVFSKTMSTPPVVVVGSGLAGLSASYEALQRGAPSVHLLDRAPKPGGNSIKASSGINGAGTEYQRAAGVESDTLFYSDSVKSAGSRFHLTQPPVDREALITKLTTESAAAVNWLVDEIGVDLSVVAPLGGHSVARTHRGAGKTPPGAAIIVALLSKLKENEKFSITSLAEVKALLKEGNTVKGVEYEFEGKKHNLEGSVLFASGGFAGDATGLLARYRPDLKGIPSTNEERPGSHDILTAVGAELLDMDSVQIHPTGFVDPATPNSMLKFLAAEMLRGEGGILLSPDGSRFVNEMNTREHVSNAIMKLPTATDGDGVIKQWDITILLDPGASAASANHIGFYEWKGLLKKVKVRDLKPAQIAAVDKYAKAVAEGTDDEFGRKQRGRWTLKAGEENRDEDIYIGRVTPITHFTMGGVAIDEKARVLTKSEDKLVPIPGLFAAGEITGGIHGDNRLGGSSLLECVVYGRTAGAGVVGSDQCEGSARIMNRDIVRVSVVGIASNISPIGQTWQAVELHAGPAQFVLDSPWWLLLETTFLWSPDLEDQRRTYEFRLVIWLSGYGEAETSMDTSAYNTFPVPLSTYMRQSWQTGPVFLSYAAHKRLFGDWDPRVMKDDLYKTRIDLLSDDERAATESFVQRKMAEGKERRIVEWDETEAKKRFS
ncbi:aromatic-amino-acid decarboxylase [Fusarium coicis]|nr:aromatic-amino-acid decarboxylase [Fusarium coicis]